MRRCDEMERKLRYLEKEIKKDGIPMLDTGENPEAPQPREMIDLEVKISLRVIFNSFKHPINIRLHLKNWKMNYARSTRMRRR